MPQSLANLLIHVIFSTKDRAPLIGDEVRKHLHGYVAGVLQSLDSPALAINSMADHIHILCQLSRTASASDLVGKIKASSSKWMKAQGIPAFAWQSGYGVFSVSQSNMAAVRQYIEGQAEHHRVTSFQDELKKFLAKHEVQYDERYVWD